MDIELQDGLLKSSVSYRKRTGAVGVQAEAPTSIILGQCDVNSPPNRCSHTPKPSSSLGHEMPTRITDSHEHTKRTKTGWRVGPAPFSLQG